MNKKPDYARMDTSLAPNRDYHIRHFLEKRIQANNQQKWDSAAFGASGHQLDNYSALDGRAGHQNNSGLFIRYKNFVSTLGLWFFNN